MIRAVIIDKNKNSRDSISSLLNEIGGINLVFCYEDFDSLKNTEEIDLVIFDINSKESEKLLNKVKNIKNTYFIATSYEINSELVSLALKNNVSDFILKPVIKPILVASIEKIRTLKENKTNFANIISVFSNKGGVGKTSLAVNLAYEIVKNSNEKVCLLDLSSNKEDACVFLNIKPKTNSEYILSKTDESDKELLLSFLDRYQNTNLYLFPTLNEDIIPSKYNIKTVNKIITFLKNLFSYIIIDTSGIVDENSINILNNSDLILLLALENMSSIRNCQKCYELFDNIGYDDDKIKLIISRYTKNSQITVDDIEKTVSKKVFSMIPNNYLTLIDAINLGHPVGEVNPNSNIAKAYRDIAVKILNIDFSGLPKIKYNHGIYNLLRRMGE